MAFLTDVARKHIFRDRQRTRSSEHVLHPFTNTVGANKDMYEILRSMEPGKKRSAHVSYLQLAEMFAHDCFVQFNIRLRMNDPSGGYPSSPPGMHPRQEDIVAGSDFERVIARVDSRGPLSNDLKNILATIDVKL
jgi:hypothetical protein